MPAFDAGAVVVAAAAAIDPPPGLPELAARAPVAGVGLVAGCCAGAVRRVTLVLAPSAAGRGGLPPGQERRRDRPPRLDRLAAARAAHVAPRHPRAASRSAARPLAVAPLRYLLRPGSADGGHHLPRLPPAARSAATAGPSSAAPSTAASTPARRTRSWAAGGSARTTRGTKLCALRGRALLHRLQPPAGAAPARTAARARRARASTARPAATCSATASATPRWHR